MTTRHLGATYVEYSVWLVTEMNKSDFFKVVIFILKQVLSCCYATFLRLGGYKWYAYKGGTFSSLMLTTIMTRCHQYLQADKFGNDKPASFTSSSKLKIRWVFQRPIFFLKALGAESNELFFTIFLCEKPVSANWLWSCPVDPDFLEEGNDKDLRMIMISLTWINPN